MDGKQIPCQLGVIFPSDLIFPGAVNYPALCMSSDCLKLIPINLILNKMKNGNGKQNGKAWSFISLFLSLLIPQMFQPFTHKSIHCGHHLPFATHLIGSSINSRIHLHTDACAFGALYDSIFYSSFFNKGIKTTDCITYIWWKVKVKER